MNAIPFNRPFLCGRELEYIRQAVGSGHLSGNGPFTKKCHQFFRRRFGFEHCLLTTSCTDALEMAAILCELKPDDEVIAPSFTFVSTVNAFVLRGARIVFADSQPHHPNLDIGALECLITPKTRAIVAVHYAGMACDMDALMDLARRHDLLVVEDAAQAIDARYQDRFLGGIGHFGCFSFHETKNINAGEGGLLTINDERFAARAEIIWEKGTNRSAFFRGEVDKYGWVDIGSSFLPSELTAAFLYAQLEHIDEIQDQRKRIWERYYDGLKVLADKSLIEFPSIPGDAENNGHMFYFMTRDAQVRGQLLAHLKRLKIGAVFHYLSLHRSAFFAPQYQGPALPHADRFTDCLVRLPLFFGLTHQDQRRIIDSVIAFFTD